MDKVDAVLTMARGEERATLTPPEVTIRDATTFAPAALSTVDVRTLLGLVTEDEFGRAVGVVGPTIAIWRNKGEGPPFYRFRRNILYRTADIVQWIIENTWDPKTGELLLSPPPAELNSGELRGDGTRVPAGIKSTRLQEEQRGAVGDHVPSVD
jgi:hypothetical protein